MKLPSLSDADLKFDFDLDLHDHFKFKIPKMQKTENLPFEYDLDTLPFDLMFNYKIRL